MKTGSKVNKDCVFTREVYILLSLVKLFYCPSVLIPFFLVYVRPNFVDNTESCLVLLKMARHHGFHFGEISMK